MVFAAHWRISAQGTIYGERCSMGISVAGEQVTLPVFGDWVGLNDVLTQSTADFTTFLNALAPAQGSGMQWQGLHVTEWDNHGAITGAADKLFTTPINGTGSSTLPGWMSLVGTLLTDRPGRKYRGRIYMPILGGSLWGTTGNFNSTWVDVYANALTALISGLNNAPGLDTRWNSFKCVIASQVGDGHNESIKRVRVNSLPDTQRRRQNEAPPAYTKVGTPTGS